VKQRIMGLPGDLVFRTKGQLAIDILTEVFADGRPAGLRHGRLGMAGGRPAMALGAAQGE
jgi:hypothetical protein